MIDVLQVDCNKTKLDNEFRIHYDNCPCDIGMINFAAGIIKGRHLKTRYFVNAYFCKGKIMLPT